MTNASPESFLRSIENSFKGRIGLGSTDRSSRAANYANLQIQAHRESLKKFPIPRDVPGSLDPLPCRVVIEKNEQNERMIKIQHILPGDNEFSSDKFSGTIYFDKINFNSFSYLDTEVTSPFTFTIDYTDHWRSFSKAHKIVTFDSNKDNPKLEVILVLQNSDIKSRLFSNCEI